MIKWYLIVYNIWTFIVKPLSFRKEKPVWCILVSIDIYAKMRAALMAKFTVVNSRLRIWSQEIKIQ